MCNVMYLLTCIRQTRGGNDEDGTMEMAYTIYGNLDEISVFCYLWVHEMAILQY